MIDARNERHLYVVCVASGWRIERPSGHAVERALESYADAEALLIEAGYRCDDNRRYQWSLER